MSKDVEHINKVDDPYRPMVGGQPFDTADVTKREQLLEDAVKKATPREPAGEGVPVSVLRGNGTPELYIDHKWLYAVKGKLLNSFELQSRVRSGIRDAVRAGRVIRLGELGDEERISISIMICEESASFHEDERKRAVAESERLLRKQKGPGWHSHLNLNTEEMLAIFNLVERIERLGADPLLTHVVTHLGHARGRLAEWIDKMDRQAEA